MRVDSLTQLAQLRCANVVQTFAKHGDNFGIISCGNVIYFVNSKERCDNVRISVRTRRWFNVLATFD